MKAFGMTLFLVLAILTCVGCADQSEAREVAFNALYPGDLNKVDKIVIEMRMKGKKKTITDAAEVKAWVERIRVLRLIEDRNQEPRTGGSTFITIYENGKEMLTFTPDSINGTFYSTKEDVSSLFSAE